MTITYQKDREIKQEHNRDTSKFDSLQHGALSGAEAAAVVHEARGVGAVPDQQGPLLPPHG